ncbi:MAG: hypothetical protein AAF745_10425, partial [Planctomycetota bacterium]
MFGFSRRPQINFRQALHRRSVLRGSGVAMGLPWLSAMSPSFAATRTQTPIAAPKRFVAMTMGLGLVRENLVPDGEGRSYKATRYLGPLDDLLDQLTVVSRDPNS